MASVLSSALSLGRSAAWCLLVLLGLQLSLGLLAGAFPSAANDVWLLGFIHASVIGLSIREFCRVNGASLGQLFPPSTRARLGWNSLGLLLGIGIHAPASWLRDVVEQRWPTSEADQQLQLQLMRHDSWIRIGMLFLVIGLVGPIFEELFYRGCLFHYLETTVGTRVSWLFSSIAFALTHAAVRDWPSLFLVALGLGGLRWAARALSPSMYMHAAFNCVTLVAVVLGEPSI